MLTITSLLSILLLIFHLSDEVVRGFEPGGTNNITGALILVVWLCGTLALNGRRSGFIIILLGSILGTGIPVLHMTGAGLVGPRVVNSGRVLFWVWTLITRCSRSSSRRSHCGACRGGARYELRTELSTPPS
jgi:hypothetical protein